MTTQTPSPAAIAAGLDLLIMQRQHAHFCELPTHEQTIAFLLVQVTGLVGDLKVTLANQAAAEARAEAAAAKVAGAAKTAEPAEPNKDAAQ